MPTEPRVPSTAMRAAGNSSLAGSGRVHGYREMGAWITAVDKEPPNRSNLLFAAEPATVATTWLDSRPCVQSAHSASLCQAALVP